MDWIYNQAASVSTTAEQAARQRQETLTKPPGSLGRLEEVAVLLAGLQNNANPGIAQPSIVIFAADHGVCEEGVSAFPQEVTVQMIMNFAKGGAAISVLACDLDIDFQIINLGTVFEVPEHDKVRQFVIDKGTNNFSAEDAMSMEQLERSLTTGKILIDEVHKQGCDIFIGGEMGIGNTTSATALACACMSKPADEIAGLGTGINADGLQRKIDTIEKALLLHQLHLDDAKECLRRLGGFEIAALSASYIRCAQLGIPVLVDGFICSAAALIAVNLNKSIKPWLIFSHQSAEQGHKLLLEFMQVTPLLSLDMRLGEGSGAAVSLPLLKLACTLHNNMATFDEAGVTNN
ncbi:MAG: nicotinate-nucleotide--dimethylbenzimidazole phosphoribosyltransferase [Gammaproteobacteria bacterium]|nr:nicotinate-nucleotide--dimethylbenzimidazole phosphoribosyltransferase [Gammaproteobacteria bacterium]